MLNESILKVFRLALPNDESGTSGKRDYQNTDLLLSGFLKLSGPEFAAMNDGEYGKFYQFFIDDFNADVRIGDRLVDNDDSAVFYQVSGVQKSTTGPGRKTEIVCHLPKS